MTQRTRDGRRVNIAGTAVDTDSMASVVSQILDHCASRGEPAFVVTPNAARILEQRKSLLLQRIYNDAMLATPDGVAVVWAARFLKSPVAGRVNGTDLFVELCRRAPQHNLRVAMVGWRPGSVERAAQRLHSVQPKLNIVLAHCPTQSFHKDPAESSALLQMIRTATPDLLFVGLGSPLEETWISENHASLNVPMSIGIGASFDFVGGTIQRAPRWMQRAGLEWLYRLLREPKRLWRRYVLGNPRFVALVLAQKLGLLK